MFINVFCPRHVFHVLTFVFRRIQHDVNVTCNDSRSKKYSAQKQDLVCGSPFTLTAWAGAKEQLEIDLLRRPSSNLLQSYGRMDVFSSWLKYMALENRRIKMLLSVEISVLVQTLLVMCLGNNGQKRRRLCRITTRRIKCRRWTAAHHAKSSGIGAAVCYIGVWTEKYHCVTRGRFRLIIGM